MPLAILMSVLLSRWISSVTDSNINYIFHYIGFHTNVCEYCLNFSLWVTLWVLYVILCVNIHLDVCVCVCVGHVSRRVCLIGEQLAWQATSDEGIMGWRLCLALSFVEMIAREHLVSNQHQFPQLPTAAAINHRAQSVSLCTSEKHSYTV